jgi:hypothetical protein
MQRTELPDTVREALGAAAARDLVDWLEQRLSLADSITISARVVRQKVNVLLLEQVSNLLLARDPTLVALPEGKWVWRVPVDLTFPTRGRVGPVGEVDVDAQYGEIRVGETLLERIRSAARQLAQQTLVYG